MPKRTRLRALLAKDESSYGSDPTATGSANAILCTELSIEPIQSDEVSRDLIRSYLGNYDTLLANTRAQVTITVEMAGSGAAGSAPHYAPLLTSCGMSQTIASGTSVTYAPISTGFDSCTIVYNADGIQHKLTGCRGTYSLNCEVGSIPTITFVMTGLYNAPTDTTMPTCTFQNQADPLVFKNGNTSAFQFHSFAGSLQSFTFDMNNEVVYRELVGGTKEVQINNRTPSGTVQIENVALSAKNFFTNATSNVSGNNTFLHGTTAGNKLTVTMPKANITAPAYASVDEIDMLDLAYTAVPNSGNDEVSLVFT